MFYFIMTLWLFSLAGAIIMFVLWAIAKVSKKGSSHKAKIASFLFLLSIVFLIAGIAIDANETKAITNTVTMNEEKDDSMIIDANKFSKISPDELVSIMGEPELIEDANFKLSETRSYKTKYYSYENNTYEFMIIDNEVVRFTYYGGKFEEGNEEEVFKKFNISTGPNLKKVAETPAALRFQMVNDKIADFWITYTDDISIYKITYNMNYFS
ncbi:hypothetical protein [Paenibacillus faecalis]|uniref:hypothetical protein n=1 Tax=Paenibacillus faecalis TaxID=2079532 RepID=UPI000D0E4B8A|nr:hypothetical protein [Paenibacillus faecalis]